MGCERDRSLAAPSLGHRPATRAGSAARAGSRPKRSTDLKTGGQPDGDAWCRQVALQRAGGAKFHGRMEVRSRRGRRRGAES